jgi:hypothetical protein
MTPFPEIAPFRVDQVIQAPLPMAYLFIAQGLTALLIQIAGILKRRRLWVGAVITFLMLVLAPPTFSTCSRSGNLISRRRGSSMPA